MLHLDGRSTLRLPYETRRALLADLALTLDHLQVPPSWVDLDAGAVAQVAADRGLEGVVAKRVRSVYQPGRRSRDWIKTPFRHTTEVVVGGWVTDHASNA